MNATIATETRWPGSLQRMVRRLVEFMSWWLWRRWRIYCPKGDVSHLFERPDFQRSLFDYDEAFVSPCTLNETNCGGVRGRWNTKNLHHRN